MDMLCRYQRFELWVFGLIYGLVNVAAAIPILLWGIGTVVFGILIGVTLFFEGLILFAHVGGVRREWPFLVVGLVVFLVAFLIWMLSKTSGTFLYMPDSWFQGHGVWHILSAVATGLFFLYFRTETTT